MKKTRGKLLAFAFTLVIVALACTSVYDFRYIDQDLCEAMGGYWFFGPELEKPNGEFIYPEARCMEPRSYSTPTSEENNELKTTAVKPTLSTRRQ